MKLLHFSARGLNGYLEFELDLNRDLSFLVGINGSGKTTVLRAIMALIGPDVGWLTTTQFSEIRLTLLHQSTTHSIAASKVSGGTLISIDGLDKPLEYVVTPDMLAKLTRNEEDYVYDDDGNMIRVRETHIVAPDSIDVFKAIKALPTPIFLGLDRSTLPSIEPRSRARTRAAAARRGHATLRTFLDESVAQAESIAISAGRSAVVERTRLAATLREKVLLSLFSDVTEIVDAGKLPSKNDIRRFEATRRSLKSAFSVLGISRDTISSTIDPFFTNIINYASTLSQYNNPSNAFDSTHRDILFRWLNLSPRLSLLDQVESLVKEFNGAERKIFESIRRYEDIINSFLIDSRKQVTFGEDGDLKIFVPSSPEGNVYYLSSGERQLFVLITTLMFNRDSTQADVLIIDEPELSLHIQWQTMFVDALQQANPDIQIILATHSPSIINGRDDFCVDLA